jgi:hypothetical protein
MIFHQSEHWADADSTGHCYGPSVLPSAMDILPTGRATLASAVLPDAIHSAVQGVELREGVNFFFRPCRWTESPGRQPTPLALR